MLERCRDLCRALQSFAFVMSAGFLVSACITGAQSPNPNDRLRFAFEPRSEAGITLTDNANLTESNRISDAVASISPGLNIRRRGPRLNASVDYTMNALYFMRQGTTDIRHNLTGLADLEVWKDHLRVEARASLRQTFLDRTAGLSGSIGNNTDNRRLVQTYTGSWIFNGDLRNWADINTRYDFTAQLSPADNLNDTTLSTNFSDTLSHNFSHQISTGDRFNRFYAAGSVAIRRVSRSLNVRDFRDDTALVELGYRFSPRFRVRGGAGWTINNLQLVQNQEDGFTWNAGFDWSPSRRTEVSFNYGKEGNREISDISIGFEPTKRIRVTANYQDQVQANTFELTEGVLDLNFDEDFGITTASGLPANANDPAFTLNDVDFRQKRASATIQWNHRRDSYFINGTYEERTFDDGSGRSTTWGISQRWRRQINPREEISAGSSFRRNEFEGGDRVDDNWRASIEYKNTFSRFFIGAITYSWSYRNSTVQGGDLLENAVTLYLRATF